MIKFVPTSRVACAILRVIVVHPTDWTLGLPKARISAGLSFHKCDKVATSCSCRLALIRSTVFHNTVLGSDRSWRSCYMANSVMEPYSSTDYSIVDEKKTRVRKPPSKNRHRCVDKKTEIGYNIPDQVLTSLSTGNALLTGNQTDCNRSDCFGLRL